MAVERGDGEPGTVVPGNDAQDAIAPNRMLALIGGIVVVVIVITAIVALVRPGGGQRPTDSVLRLGADDLSDKSVLGRSGLAPVGMITGERPIPYAAPRLDAIAPDLAWITPEGTPTQLSALRGHAVVINFWATWCVPCRQEMPVLDRIASGQPDLTILAVDLQEDSDSVRAFFERYRITSLVPLIDPAGAIFRRFGVASLPTTFFVDRNGVIRGLEIGGPISEDRLRADIAKATTP